MLIETSSCFDCLKKKLKLLFFFSILCRPTTTFIWILSWNMSPKLYIELRVNTPNKNNTCLCSTSKFALFLVCLFDRTTIFNNNNDAYVCLCVVLYISIIESVGIHPFVGHLPSRHQTAEFVARHCQQVRSTHLFPLNYCLHSSNYIHICVVVVVKLFVSSLIVCWSCVILAQRKYWCVVNRMWRKWTVLNCTYTHTHIYI